MHVQQANFCDADVALFKPVQPLITWYCDPCCVTQMLCGNLVGGVGVGVGLGLVGGAVGSSGSCRSGSKSGSSTSAAAAAAVAVGAGRVPRLAFGLVVVVSAASGPAACAMRQQRPALQHPHMKPKRKINIMTIYREPHGGVLFVQLLWLGVDLDNLCCDRQGRHHSSALKSFAQPVLRV